MIRRLYTLFSSKNKTENKKSEGGETGSMDSDDRDYLFANLSHEIRTPVNGIVGFTQLLKETTLTNEQNELVNTIHSSSMHLLSLVSDILDFSKINANKLEFESIPFDLFNQVEDTVEVYAVLAQKKQIELGVFIEPNITPMLIGDPTKLSQVIGNLVSNAVKFTEAQGEVQVCVEKITEDAETIALKFSVKDTGIGIEEKDQKKIFDAFVQANSSINREFGGTGLGLAISSRIVQYMGGELRLDSSFGVGSEFSFILNFQKTRAQDRKLYHDLYMGLHIGFLLPMQEMQKIVDIHLKKNLEYLGADFTFFFGSELFSMEKERYPDILFIDESRNRIDIASLSALGIKLVLIRTLESKKIDTEKLCKIIYKPLNLTKTIRALEICTDNSDKYNEDTIINKDFSNLKALVVDDNEINQKLLVKLLSDMQMDTEVASNGIEAIALCKNSSFDIIFMDIEMPEMGGIEATQKLLEFEREKKMRHTPIIALTGNISIDDVQKYKDTGFDSTIAKPIDIDILISHLDQYAICRNLVLHKEKKDQKFSGSRALIIEDNIIDQKIIERALARKGVESVSVVIGVEIVNIYKSTPFDIIFLNASTPVMNAIEIIKDIRSFEKYVELPSIPIIVMFSPDSKEQHFDLYREIGANGYLMKPLDIDEIKFQLDQYIQETFIEDKIPLDEREEEANSETEQEDMPLTQDSSRVVETVEKEEVTVTEEAKPSGDVEERISSMKKDAATEEKKTSQYTITYIDIPLSK